MAKLLGQEIVTHEEFENFRSNELKRFEIQMQINATEIKMLKADKKSLRVFIVLSALSLITSVAAIGLVLFH